MAGQLIALFKWRMDAYVVMPALMLVIAVPAGLGVRRGKQSAANALLPLGLFLLAFAFRQADVERLLCWLGSGVFQGHALWHGLTAASLWMMLIALLMPSAIPTAHRSPLFSVTRYAKRGVQNGATCLDNGWALRTDGYPQGGQRSRREKR